MFGVSVPHVDAILGVPSDLTLRCIGSMCSRLSEEEAMSVDPTGLVKTAFGLVSLLGCSGIGCTSDNDPTSPSTSTQALTYYDDVLPIVEQSCLGCHQQGGIGPIRLDTYASAKQYAASMKTLTAARIMPPWGATSDGSCGDFRSSLALSDDAIATIGKWADAGASEGKSRQVKLPALPGLSSAQEYPTPLFSPEPQGGQLAEFDEYRCFMLDSGVASQMFITGVEVVPGTPEIVHHVLAFIVDPAAPASDGSGTNLAKMSALDAESPDRLGWPCFGMAGDGVSVAAVPVTWAPGQGVLEYPGQSGVPLLPKHKLVVQVHYNLADTANLGKTDQTRVRLQLAASVSRVGIFALPDPFLRSLSNPDGPFTLAPGEPSVKFTWMASLADLGLGSIPDLQLYGVGPHMHQRGRKIDVLVGESTGASSCAVDVQNWDFHWQRFYFYNASRQVDANTQVSVTCDYDTSSDTTPVLPGWGTRNEMCLAALYFTAPLAAGQ